MTQLTKSWPVRVYYEDTDHAGMVYYANYLKFMERARSEFLRSAGLELDHIHTDFGVMFAVTEANIRYHTPALFNDLLIVESSIVTLRGARIIFKQHIFRQDGHKLLTAAEIHLACINQKSKVSRIPAPVYAVLKKHL